MACQNRNGGACLIRTNLVRQEPTALDIVPASCEEGGEGAEIALDKCDRARRMLNTDSRESSGSRLCCLLAGAEQVA